MPKEEQSLPLYNTDTETALAISYQALNDLGWTADFAGDIKISGSTPKSWKSAAQQIIIDAEDGQLTVTSEMVNGESFDLGGRNKKNIAQFVFAYEAAKNKTNATQIENNTQAINALRIKTFEALETSSREAAEVDKAMNISGSNLYVTYALIAINVLVFIVMIIDGAGFMGENGGVHLKWGANFAGLTLSGDWWRLITCTFIHFGIIHLAMNMYCLYMIGNFLEPMLGKTKYITAYLCTGVFASLASLWWHNAPVISAGASGAVFGMFGLFLAMLTTSLIPRQVRQSLLQNIGIFIAFNLFYGLKGGVDNSAHIGGLVSGFIIGYLYVYGIKKERVGQKTMWMIPVLILITAGITYTYLQQNKVNETERINAKKMVTNESYKDDKKFNDKLIEFDSLSTGVNDILRDTTLSYAQLKLKIEASGLPDWQKAEELLRSTNDLEISAESHTKAEKLLQFIEFEKTKLNLILKLIETENQEEFMPQINDMRNKADSVFAEAVKL